MKEQLSRIIDLGSYEHALVEAGYFYGNRPLSEEQQRGVTVGQNVTGALTEMGLHVTTCLLIDDYNVPNIYEVQNLEVLKEWGFKPSVIYRETLMIPGAESILIQLEANNKTKLRNGSKYLKDGFKRLVSNKGKYGCALLDAALYAEKYRVFSGVCVTVLPDTYGYRIQQQTARSILKGCGLSVPVLNVYFQQDSSASLGFNC